MAGHTGPSWPGPAVTDCVPSLRPASTVDPPESADRAP